MNHKEHKGLHRKDRKGRKEQPPPFGLSEKIFQNIKHLGPLLLLAVLALCFGILFLREAPLALRRRLMSSSPSKSACIRTIRDYQRSELHSLCDLGGLCGSIP